MHSSFVNKLFFSLSLSCQLNQKSVDRRQLNWRKMSMSNRCVTQCYANLKCEHNHLGSPRIYRYIWIICEMCQHLFKLKSYSSNVFFFFSSVVIWEKKKWFIGYTWKRCISIFAIQYWMYTHTAVLLCTDHYSVRFNINAWSLHTHRSADLNMS